MARIKSIELKQITNERLYNLSVRDDESFVANGIVVHNCKSYIVPILILPDGAKIESLSPRKLDGYSNEQIIKSQQFSESIKDCSCFSKEGTFF